MRVVELMRFPRLIDSGKRCFCIGLSMPKQATLQDIADAAGVHRSTVTLALRDHSRISVPQRNRIKEIAARLGYRINPLVAALMKARRTGSELKALSIAYVTCYPTRWGWRPPHVDRPDYFGGASARAQELGYTLEHFWLAEPKMSVTRFCDILSNRSINGVLIGRLPPALHSIDFQWDRFSCVTLGRTLHNPSIHRVTEDHFASAQLAMGKLIAQGYSRIGLVFSEPDDSPEVGDRWIGGYLRKQMLLKKRDRLPWLAHDSKSDMRQSFAQWCKRWQPDAILVTQAQPVLAWMKELGLRPCSDLGVATLVNDHLENGWTGIHSDPELMGALATDMVVGMMHRNEVGVPFAPHEVLLPGAWVAGTTTR